MRNDDSDEVVEPLEHKSEADRSGMTAREGREDESLDARLAQEEPDVSIDAPALRTGADGARAGARGGLRLRAPIHLPPDGPQRRWALIALWAVAVGAAARAVWVFVLHQPLHYVYSDMGGYVDRAVKLAEGGHLDRGDAFYPPGTHIVLAAPMKLLGTGHLGLWGGEVLWWAMSSLTPLLMWRLAALLLTPAAAALTAVFCAAWPLHIMYAGWFLSETPSLFFLVLALWLGYLAGRELGARTLPVAIFAGLAAGAAIANRPQFLLNVGILAMMLLFGVRRNRTAFVGVAIGTAIVLGGVVAHNSVAAGKLTGLDENGGMTFWLGQCDVGAVQATDPATNSTWSFGSPPAAQRHNAITFNFPDHAVWEQGFFYSKGLDCIRDDGLNHLALTARSVVDMTATTIPWPPSGEGGLLSQVATLVNVVYSVALPFIVFGAVALVRRRRRTSAWPGELVLLAHLLCFVPLAVLVFGDSRFRIPYDVFGLALLAALIADRLPPGQTFTASPANLHGLPGQPSRPTLPPTSAS
jgi:hypothetical protein